RPAPRNAFKPGQSGNPAGRPKKHRDFNVEALARQHTPEAIAALVAALEVPRERVAAAQVLLDRGWGRPRQSLDLGAEGDRVTAVQLNIVSLPVPQAPPPNGADAIDDAGIIDGEIAEVPGIIAIGTVRPDDEPEDE